MRPAALVHIDGDLYISAKQALSFMFSHNLKLRKPWKAKITACGKAIYLGYFTTQEEAATAYNRAAKELFGEHACLNKIEEVK